MITAEDSLKEVKFRIEAYLVLEDANCDSEVDVERKKAYEDCLQIVTEELEKVRKDDELERKASRMRWSL